MSPLCLCGESFHGFSPQRHRASRSFAQRNAFSDRLRFTDFAAKFSLLPSDEESVSKLVSEPGAVAMGSNNSAKLDDPVATALGSDTDALALGVSPAIAASPR